MVVTAAIPADDSAPPPAQPQQHRGSNFATAPRAPAAPRVAQARGAVMVPVASENPYGEPAPYSPSGEEDGHQHICDAATVADDGKGSDCGGEGVYGGVQVQHIGEGGGGERLQREDMEVASVAAGIPMQNAVSDGRVVEGRPTAPNGRQRQYRTNGNSTVARVLPWMGANRHPKYCACGGFRPKGRAIPEPYCLDRKDDCALQ